MTGYPFVEQLLQNIGAKSQALQGRVYFAPGLGAELQSSNLDQVLKEIPALETKRYPLSLILPPKIRNTVSYRDGAIEEWLMTQLFLKTSFNKGDGRVQNPNVNTGTSKHTILEDWHDMKRVAVDFFRALDYVQTNSLKELAGRVRYIRNKALQIDEITNLGADRLAGVKVDYILQVFVGCEVEDYTQDDLASISLPDCDSHPIHSM